MKWIEGGSDSFPYKDKGPVGSLTAPDVVLMLSSLTLLWVTPKGSSKPWFGVETHTYAHK